MKQTEYRSLGIDLKLSTPETVDEFNLLAKRPNVNACLVEATNNVVYRGMLAKFRANFLKEVEAQTNIERHYEVILKDGKPVVKDGEEATKWTETEGDYFKRVCAEKKVEPVSFQSLADKVAETLVFDPTESETEPKGPVKLAKMYVEKATEVLTQGRHEKVIQHIQKDLKDTVPVPVLADGDSEEVKTKNINALGHYIKAHISWKEKNSVAKY